MASVRALFCVLGALLALLQVAFAAEVSNLRGGVEARPPPRPKLNACWKDGEGRGSGVLPSKEDAKRTCPAEKPEKSMGLCYAKCSNDKREGFGPLCWDNCSKMTYKANGVVFCCDNDDTCSQLVTDLAIKIPEALVRFAVDISVNPANVLKILKDFRELVADALELELPLCKDVKGEIEEAPVLAVEEDKVVVAEAM